MRDIIKWHRHKFPKATADSQILHLLQEVREFEKAESDHVLEELADIYIVANSLKRWKRAQSLAKEALDYYFYDFSYEYRDEILKAVEEKLKIVDKREYFWNGVDYDRIRCYR